MSIERKSWSSPERKWEDLTRTDLEAEDMLNLFKIQLTQAGLELNPEGKFLDIGSGKGALIEYARTQGIDMIGVDREPRNNFSNQVAAHVEQLPFRDETFDYVTSVGTFDTSVYQQNQDAMINEIARVLKTGGIFYLNYAGNKLPEFPGFEKLYEGTIGHTAIYRKM